MFYYKNDIKWKESTAKFQTWFTRIFIFWSIFFFQSKNVGMLKLHMMISLTSQTPTESEVSI